MSDLISVLYVRYGGLHSFNFPKKNLLAKRQAPFIPYPYMYTFVYIKQAARDLKKQQALHGYKYKIKKINTDT